MIINTPGLTLANQIFNEPIQVVAPGVSFYDCLFQGRQRDEIMLETGPATKLDHCIMNGHAQGQRAGIRVHSANVQILRTMIRGIYHYNDAQAIGAIHSTKNLIIDGCYLEASGENILFGGGDVPTIDDICSDILICYNTLTKPLTWRGKSECTVKNLLELKCSKRVRIIGNDMSYSWVHGQVGYAIVLTTRNQYNHNPWACIEDTVFEKNTVRSMAGGINILGFDDIYPSDTVRKLQIIKNTFVDIDPIKWGSNGRTIQLANGPDDVLIEENTFVGNGPCMNGFLYLHSKPTTRLKIKNNLAEEGLYGIIGDGQAPGINSLEKFAPGYEWSDIRLKRTIPSNNYRYPVGTTIVT